MLTFVSNNLLKRLEAVNALSGWLGVHTWYGLSVCNTVSTFKVIKNSIS